MAEHARRRAWRWLYAVLVVLAVGYLWAGYGAGWAWTGLSRRVTLWDWLSLALLPLVIATSTLWRPRAGWTGRRLLVLIIAAVAAMALVLAGYLVPWPWTGFTGNTAWDWIKLLLLPVLIPTVVLPRLLDVLLRSFASSGAIIEA